MLKRATVFYHGRTIKAPATEAAAAKVDADDVGPTGLAEGIPEGISDGGSEGIS